MARKMIDLHCHILPGIDDGAKDLECSLSLLREQKRQGVQSIMFTPHFNREKKSVEEFVALRDAAYRKLIENEEFQSMNISVKTAAEIYFAANLDQMDLSKLSYGDSNYVLLELPFHFKPHGLMYVVDNVLNRGYIPIIAHVERYDYIAKEPDILYELAEKGCLAHINAETLIKDSSKSSMPMKYIKWGLVHFLCTDCHSMEKRPPKLEEAYSILEKKLGQDYCDDMLENAACVFNGEPLDLTDNIRKPKKFLGSWI